MSISDPVADMLTKIRNATRAKLPKVEISVVSKLKKQIVQILASEGYIDNFETVEKNGFDTLTINLRYDENEQSVIHDLQSISTPGRRFYTGYDTMPRVFNGFGTLIVSTSSGVMTGKSAKKKKIGGEIICKIW